jgi:hypothetical protein
MALEVGVLRLLSLAPISTAKDVACSPPRLLCRLCASTMRAALIALLM